MTNLMTTSRSRESIVSASDVSASGRGAKKTRLRLRNLALQVTGFAAVFLLWVTVTRLNLVSPLVVPPPGEVGERLREGLFGGLWLEALGVTLTETLIGFLIGTLVGLLVGATFAFVEVIRIAFYPLVIALLSFPKIAVAPLLITVLGYGMAPKIVVAALLAFFPVMTAATAGLSAVDPDERNLMRAVGAKRRHELRYLRLPNAMAHVFPALDVALILALLGVIASELIGASAGLGYQLSISRTYGEVDGMYALLILMAGIGVSMHLLFIVLRRVLPVWLVPKLDH